MIQLATYFIAGFILQLMMITSLAPSWWILAMWSLLLLFLIFYRTKLYFPPDHPHFSKRKKNILLSMILLGLLIISFIYIEQLVYREQDAYAASPLHQYAEQEHAVNVTGRLYSSVEQDGQRIRFDLTVHYIDDQAVEYPYLIRVQRYAATEEELEITKGWSKGDLFQGALQIKYPQRARNPGAFDYQSFLRNHHIFFTAEAVDTNWGVLQSKSFLDQGRKILEKQRLKWIEQINAIFSSDVAGIVQAMTVGYRAELETSLVDMYQQLGIVHVLAISGLHVGIVVYILYTLMLKLPITREKAIWLVLLLVPLFILIAGAQASVIRAGSMAMCGLLLQRFKLWKHSLFVLYLVFFLHSLSDPFLIYQIGFQLSYFVTFMLLAASPYVSKWLGAWISVKSINQALTIALVADLASLPFLVYHFHLFSPVALVVNLIIVPLYSALFIPGSFLLTILSFVHPAFSSLGVILFESLLQTVHQLLKLVYEWPFSVLYFGRPSSWWLAGYSCILLTFSMLIEKQKRVLAGISLGLIGVWIIVHLSFPFLDQRAHLTLLDVGQGEAIVLEAPYRKEIVVIDLGGQVRFEQEEWKKRKNEFEAGRDIVLPYLRYRGINKIDKLIFTHGHFDHMGGIQGVLGQIKIKEVYKSPIQPISEFETQWLEKIQEKGIPILPLRRNDQWSVPHFKVQVLFPEQQDLWREWLGNPHDYNLVLLNEIYGYRFLWTGDVTAEGEREILHHYPELSVDVLNLAHHGSDTSTSLEFLRRLQPKIGLISLGKNNLYGHPHPEVLKRAEQEAEMLIFRTDLHGGIYIQVSPQSLRVKTTLE